MVMDEQARIAAQVAASHIIDDLIADGYLEDDGRGYTTGLTAKGQIGVAMLSEVARLTHPEFGEQLQAILAGDFPGLSGEAS